MRLKHVFPFLFSLICVALVFMAHMSPHQSLVRSTSSMHQLSTISSMPPYRAGNTLQSVPRGSPFFLTNHATAACRLYQPWPNIDKVLFPENYTQLHVCEVSQACYWQDRWYVEEPDLIPGGSILLTRPHRTDGGKGPDGLACNPLRFLPLSQLRRSWNDSFYRMDVTATPTCCLFCAHYGHTLTETFLPAILLLDLFAVPASKAQVIFLDTGKLIWTPPGNTSIEYGLFASSLPLPPIYQDSWDALKAPVCVPKLVAGSGCKYIHGCWMDGDLQRVRDYGRGKTGTTMSEHHLEIIIVQRKFSDALIVNVGGLRAKVADVTGITARVVIWESLTPQEQITIARRSSIMIGISSSATHNFFFLPNGSALIDIIHPQHYFANSKFCAISYPAIRCWTIDAELAPSHLNSSEVRKVRKANVLVPVASFQKALTEAWSFVKTRWQRAPTS